MRALRDSQWEWPISDVTLRGLNALLSLLPSVGLAERQQRTALLWEALTDLSRRGLRMFEVEYMWSYYHEKKTVTFDASFVKQLNEREWVPDKDGNLHAPELVAFDSLRWKPNLVPAL